MIKNKILKFALLLLFLPKLMHAATYTVTLSSDHAPTPWVGELRWAINQANANPGLDNIVFNINQALPIQINLVDSLRLNTDPIIIDGNTQPGFINSNDKKIIVASSVNNGLMMLRCNSTTQSQIKSIRFISKIYLVTQLFPGFIFYIVNAQNLLIQDCIFHHTIDNYNTGPIYGIIHSDSKSITYFGNIFGTDYTLSLHPNLAFTTSILMISTGGTLLNDNNVIGEIGLGQSNYFYNKRPESEFGSAIYARDGNGKFNKISNNVFINNLNSIYNFSLTPITYQFNNSKFPPYNFSFTTTTAGQVTVQGTVSANDVVELFAADNTNLANAPDVTTLVGTTTANASGVWSITLGSQYCNKGLIATATDAANNTSPFSAYIVAPVCSLACAGCVGTFAPEIGKTFILNAWAKENGASGSTITYTKPQIKLLFPGSGTTYTCTPSGTIIDGWQRIEKEFVVPAGATDIQIELSSLSAGDVLFDDIRIHPKDGSMKSYVYDPITLRLSAELDERNYATFYEYDEEGKLIRVKKETERGVMTVKENRNNTQKK